MATPGANEEAISTLNDLIETCRDDEQGFRLAAEGVKDSQLQAVFSDYAQRRAKFAEELQREVARLGGDPDKSGGVFTGTLYRSSMTIRSAVSAGNEGAILAEVERGADQAVKSYREALGANLQPNIKDVVRRQFRHVQHSYDRLRLLQQQRRAA